MSAKNKKGVTKDSLFTRKMLDSIDGSRIIRGNTKQKDQRMCAKQIKFARALGLVPTNHTNMLVDLS